MFAQISQRGKQRSNPQPALLCPTRLPIFPASLMAVRRAGLRDWKQVLPLAHDDGPFAVDVLTPPDTNPWLAQTRFTGLDFFPDGRIAVCSWDGDVWIIEMIANAQSRCRCVATVAQAPLAAHRLGPVPAAGPEDRRRARSTSAAATRSSSCTTSTATARPTSTSASTTTTR